VLERAIAIVENADPVPKLGVFLGTMEMVECVLISIICILKLILHEKAMSERAPYVAILVVDLDSAIEVFNSLQFKERSDVVSRAEGSETGEEDAKGPETDTRGDIIEWMTDPRIVFSATTDMSRLRQRSP
jgi:hypothetical protein